MIWPFTNRRARRREAEQAAAAEQARQHAEARQRIIDLAHPPIDDTTQIVPQITTLLTYGQQHGYQAGRR